MKQEPNCEKQGNRSSRRRRNEALIPRTVLGVSGEPYCRHSGALHSRLAWPLICLGGCPAGTGGRESASVRDKPLPSDRRVPAVVSSWADASTDAYYPPARDAGISGHHRDHCDPANGPECQGQETNSHLSVSYCTGPHFYVIRSRLLQRPIV